MISFSQSLFVLMAAMMPLGISTFGYAASLLPLGVYSGAVISAGILVAAIAFQLGRNLWEPQVFAFEHLVVRGTGIILAMGLTDALGDWLLVPLLGMSGAALATCAAFGVGAFGMLTLIRHGLGQASGPPLRGMLIFSGLAVATGVTATLLPRPLGYQLCGLATPGLILLGRRAGLFRCLALIGKPTGPQRDRLSDLFFRVLSWFAWAPGEAATDGGSPAAR